MTVASRIEPAPAAQPHIVVVGGGIAGQTAAFRLKRRGAKVTVLEANPAVVGGEMSSVAHDGFDFNRGATILPSSYTQLTKLAEEAGVAGNFKGTVPAVFAIPRHGKVHRLRGAGFGAVIDALGTGLMSFRTKLILARLGIDAQRARKHIGFKRIATELDTESIGAYCKRRLNAEAEENVIKALARGFYLYEPDDLSILDLYFAAVKFSGTAFFQYEGGIGFLNRALAEALGTVTGARVNSVRTRPGGVAVDWEQDGAQHSLEADGCIVATPAYATARICDELSSRQKEILAERIPYGAIIKASHVLNRRPEHGTIAMPIPPAESRSLGILTFEHSYRPDIPSAQGLIGSHWMNDWNQSRIDPATVSDAALETEMIPEIAKFVPGFAAMVEHSHITRWPRATICSYPGMYVLIDEFRRSIAPDSAVQYCGDYLNVPSTMASSLSGEQAADAVSARMGLPIA